MPELPDLQVIREVCTQRLLGVAINAVTVRRPLIVRNLVGGDFAAALTRRQFVGVDRHGKFLLLRLDNGASLVVNPMLAGRLRLGKPLARDRTRDVLVLGLADGNELRYHDAADMGKVYLTADENLVPTFAAQGPDADDPALTLEIFLQRSRRFTGEIKGVITNQEFVAGIGNAYADEICWSAQIYPFLRRASLSAAELGRIYAAMGEVLTAAVATLRVRMADGIDLEIRDFLAVHGKPGAPCPRCGNPISEVKRERRATHFCRVCQPGLLVGND